MFRQDLCKCSLILAPATIEERAHFESSLYALYVLYKKPESQKIQIGIPGMEKHTSLHNMDHFEEAKEKAYFLNLGYAGIDIADLIDDRPIYMIDSTEHRTVDRCTLINGVNVELDDVLNGSFEFGKRKNLKKKSG